MRQTFHLPLPEAHVGEGLGRGLWLMSTECTCRCPAGGEKAPQLSPPHSQELFRATRTTRFLADQIDPGSFTPLTFSAHRTGLASRVMLWNVATLACLFCHPDFHFNVGMRLACLCTKIVIGGCDQQDWCGVDHHGCPNKHEEVHDLMARSLSRSICVFFTHWTKVQDQIGSD
jgi:hypothetical protein